MSLPISLIKGSYVDMCWHPHFHWAASTDCHPGMDLAKPISLAANRSGPIGHVRLIDDSG
jgi:hypothetical protein